MTKGEKVAIEKVLKRLVKMMLDIYLRECDSPKELMTEHAQCVKRIFHCVGEAYDVAQAIKGKAAQ